MNTNLLLFQGMPGYLDAYSICQRIFLENFTRVRPDHKYFILCNIDIRMHFSYLFHTHLKKVLQKRNPPS